MKFFLQQGQFGRRMSANSVLASVQPSDFNNVSLLIRGNTWPFLDQSSNEWPVANISGLLSTDGIALEWSTPATNKALRVPQSAKFAFGTGSFALGAKVTPTTAGGARILDARANTSGTDAWFAGVQATTLYPFLQVGATTYGVGTPAGNLALTNNVESDVLFTYDGTNLRCFVGGALSWTHAVSLNVAAPYTVTIGNSGGGADGIGSAKLRDIIVVKGEAVTTSAYTPGAWSDPLGNTLQAAATVGTWTNVMMLLHGAGSNGSTTITDSSSYARTVSVFGNLQISTAQFRFGSSSIAFDGAGDYGSIPSSTDFAFGTGDLSVGAQVYATSNTAQKVILSCYGSSSSGWSKQIVTNTGNIGFNATGDGIDVQTGASVLGTGLWREAVIARKSGVLMALFETATGYLECVGLAMDSQSIACPTALLLGRFPGFSEYWNGYMQEVRIIKGESPQARSHYAQSGAWPDS